VRLRLALLTLALGGFSLGASEFAAMGVLPDIARDLLPELWTTSPDAAIAQAGILISSYAAGVVVGAPLIAGTLSRYPRKALLVGFAIAFTIGTVLSAAAPDFWTACAARFLAGLPHGAYFGIASIVAADLLGPGSRGRGVAFVISGLAVANIVGVPLITGLGQAAGWRIAYLVIAGLFVVTTAALALAVPHQPGDPAATIRRELGALRIGQVWLALAIGAIGFGGMLAVNSYIAPMTTELAGLSAGWVPWALVAAGLGMFGGSWVGGRLADRDPMRGLLIVLPLFALVLLGLALTGSWPPAAFAGFFLVGLLGGSLVPTVQTRLMAVAHESQTLAAASNHSALNIGNGLGAALGAAVIAAGLGYRAPSLVGAGLAVLGFLIAIAAWLAERRGRAVVADARTACPPA